MTQCKLQGIVPVLPTPFLPDESLDVQSLDRIIDFCADRGFSAVCLPAYASEFYKLSLEERYRLVEAAVQAADGRVPVIAQSNHFAAMHAAEIARRNAALGASMISVAVPRMFEISEQDAFRFLAQVLEATELPVLVQDFNPGGPTIAADTARRLHEAYPHFRYLKLEQPLMAPKVAEILAVTDGKVQILEGWGGMYLLEGIAAGVCGAMPGLAVADLQQEIYEREVAGDRDAAMDLFEAILPYLVFSLQNMELFLHIEKSLLVRRWLLAHPTVRAATLTPDPDTVRHAEFLVERVLRTLEARGYGMA